MNNAGIFVSNMFEYFKKITKDGKYENFRHLNYYDFTKKDLCNLASFLKEMQYIIYDVKNAVITMYTKNGEIYSLNDFIKFNEQNSKYLEVTGAGNEDTSLTIDGGCAIIEFKVNDEFFKEDILHIQKAVKLIELTDTFDVYPLDLIKNRTVKIADKYNISSLYLTGDYANNTATENSTIDFIVNFNELEGFNAFIFPGELDSTFKVDVNVMDENKINFNKNEVINLKTI